MDDIAKLAGVSKTTVSRVMNGSPLVNEDARQRVLVIAREQGYEVNEAARRLWQDRASALAVVVDLPDRRLSQPFQFELLADLMKAANSVRHDVLLVSPEIESPDPYRRLIASRRVDGIIFIGQGARLKIFRELAATNVPFVVWGGADPRSSYCAVSGDNRRGGELVGAHFAKLDRRRILFVGPLGHVELKDRQRGMEDGLRQHGSAFEVRELRPGDLSFGASRDAFSQFLDGCDDPPDAVFCASDTIALAVLAVLTERQIAVPARVSVVGYDDIPQASQVRPALTTVRQDTSTAAFILIEKLLQLVNGGVARSATLPVTLVVRDT